MARFTKTAIDATMCAIIAQFICDPSRLRRTKQCNLAYIMSVFIGYIGTDSIGSLIKRFAAKKLEKTEINNQRAGVPRRWRAVGGN